MKKSIALGLGILSFAVFAATKFDSQYTGQETIKPKGKPTYTVPCELGVIKTYYAGNTGKWEDLRAEVATGYAHDDESPGDFVLSPTKDAKFAGDKNVLEGKTAEGSILSVALKTAEKFETLTTYSLKWKHDGHFHNHVCKELAVKKTP
jgi:hypothetical protein